MSGSERRVTGLAAAALFAPWKLAAQVEGVTTGHAAWLAGFNVMIAAGMSTVLSSWTYLAGKGLIMGAGEMDLGQDDLPSATLTQVVGGAAGSVCVWILLLALAVMICVIVARTVFGGDPWRRTIAIRVACACTVWLVVWAAGVLVLNAVRHDAIRSPAEAIGAYAQLRQQGFAGSSAVSPGPPEREALSGPSRLSAVMLIYPVLWTVGLVGMARRPDGTGVRPIVLGLALLLAWTGWFVAWRLLPWVTLGAVIG